MLESVSDVLLKGDTVLIGPDLTEEGVHPLRVLVGDDFYTARR